MLRVPVDKRIAATWGLLAATILAALIVLGSRNLNHFDAALVGYTFATLFATFGITYRYAMWLRRPPTRMYWRRGWSVFLGIAGVMLAFRRRMVDHAAVTLQLFAQDMMPLVLLFAISITGLMLTASYTWMKGYGYDFLAILHAITVIVTLLYLPFGKLFHIFQRPAQIGVSFYKDAGRRGEQARCRRCGQPYASAMRVS